jgi:hypothetical protein
MSVRKVSLNSAPEKKPSLALLKPDKAVGVAARKRALKKIEAGMTTKVTTTKVSKKVGEKKVVIKRAIKKIKSPDLFVPDTVVALPNTISIRAREKALVFLEAMTKDFENSAKQVAYISGLCFILLGASMSLAFTTPFSDGTNQQATLASYGSTTSTLPSTTPNLTNPLPQTVPKPTFALLDSLPVQVQGKTTHRLDLTHAKYVEVNVYSSTNGYMKLQVETSNSNSRAVFTLDKALLRSGEYTAKISIKSDINDSIHTFALGSFLVPYTPVPGTTDTTDTTTASDSTTDTTDDTDSTTSTDEVITDVVDDAEVVTEPELVVQPTLKVRVPSSELSGQLAIKIEAPVPVDNVKVSVRSLKSITPILNSSAELRNGSWYYFINTENIPNGQYEIIAQTRFGDKIIKSGAVAVRVANFVQEPVTPPLLTTTTTAPPVYTAPTTQNPPAYPTQPAGTASTTSSTPLRTFSEFSLEEVSNFTSSSEEMAKEVEGEVDIVFVQYKDELRALLQRYAVAQQSGDPIMLELSKNALQDTRDRLIKDFLNNPNTNQLADNINEELDGRFEMLQKRIDTFEELRKAASNNESSSDKDGDGISDYDEQFLYGTSPEQPDTDNDGVLDGIEVMGGYNPLDPASEAVIEYELPQESFALIENELLQINAVAPVIRNDLNEQDPEVQAEIRGKGLPNSYVTIYVFSTPTIVTVRTDQDGSFVYTFEKELEDGEHEVYIAVTDNTGAIVAHSNPFKFIKQAEAFTPVDADSGVTTELASYNLQSLDVYNVIVGLGILALGLILLMLGVGLRERDKMINPALSNDLKAT